MPSPSDLYLQLSQRARTYKLRFISPFLPANPETSPSQYDLEVRSYCVLCQASFEEFYEQISTSVLKVIVDGWILRKKTSAATISLLACMKRTFELAKNDDDTEKKIYDHIRESLEDAKASFSREIFENHGASPKHIRFLLTAVGIDFTPEANTKNSILQLSRNRGTFAHKGSVTSILAPEDADKFVTDHLVFAQQISDKAEEAIAALS